MVSTKAVGAGDSDVRGGEGGDKAACVSGVQAGVGRMRGLRLARVGDA